MTTVRSTLIVWSLRKTNSLFASLALFVAGIIEQQTIIDIVVPKDTALIKKVSPSREKLTKKEIKLIIAIKRNIFGKTFLNKDDVSL